MGKRGPAPKPQALRELEGDRGKGKNAVKFKEVQTPAAPPLSEPPAHLSPIAQTEWRRLYGALQRSGLLTSTDLSAFEIYCATYGRWREAEEALAKQPRLLKTPNGLVTPNPWLTIARQSAELMKGYLVEFGMTPAARARMATSAPPPQSNQDESGPQEQPAVAGKFRGLVGRA